ERVDFRAIDEGLEAARLQRRLDAVHECQVLAGIGDENLRLPLLAIAPPTSACAHAGQPWLEILVGQNMASPSVAPGGVPVQTSARFFEDAPKEPRHSMNCKPRRDREIAPRRHCGRYASVRSLPMSGLAGSCLVSTNDSASTSSAFGLNFPVRLKIGMV